MAMPPSVEGAAHVTVADDSPGETLVMVGAPGGEPAARGRSPPVARSLRPGAAYEAWDGCWANTSSRATAMLAPSRVTRLRSNPRRLLLGPASPPPRLLLH